MAQTYRVGIQIIPSEPFWVQIGIAIEKQARKSGIDLIPIDINNYEISEVAFESLVEELLAEEINVLIILDLPKTLIRLILSQNIPIISLVEHLHPFEQIRNCPNIFSPLGLYDIGKLMAEYLISKLQSREKVLVVGGMSMNVEGKEGIGEDGRSRLAGIYDAFAPYKAVQVQHISAPWGYDQSFPSILEAMQQLNEPLEAIYGLSDTLALASRSAAERLGLLTPQTLIVGINGDPQALAAIAEGKMTATVEINMTIFSQQVLELALSVALGQTSSLNYNYTYRLITPENVAEVAAQKLIAIAELPNLLVGVNRRREQQQLTQLETSQAINRKIGSVLDRQKLIRTIVKLVRQNYKYDRVQFYVWSEFDQTLLQDDFDNPDTNENKIRVDEDEVLFKVVENGELIFIPDMKHCQRFKPNPRWSKLRSRVVLPVKLGEKLLGVLDLQRDNVTTYSREHLVGLQLLADQVAIAIRNADLYGEALAARKLAEKADKLKTLLLANVSHEFRTPLNIILGYTKEALNSSNPYNCELPLELLSDLGRVYKSGEHLLRLINDLLDLSRDEIDELDILPELIDLKTVLEEVYQSVVDQTPNRGQGPVRWQLQIPQYLPILQADPVRLRQIILNLLSNAQKYTTKGQIILGVEVQPPYVHIWVEDTGSGISIDQQEQIFEPFMMGENSSQHAGGIGLGLAITRRLVRLHRGEITVMSQPGIGSTFHVYLPLPNLSGQLVAMPSQQATQNQLNLIFISNRTVVPTEIELLSQQSNIHLFQLQPNKVRDHLVDLQPSILAWDLETIKPADWLIFDYLRNHPKLAHLPLMLYGNVYNSGLVYKNANINILLKPFNRQTLHTLIETLRPGKGRDGVLIIDDEEQCLDLYEQIVQSALPGLPLHRAESGRKALSLLKNLVPDLVIIDLLMPEVDGAAVIEWMRNNSHTRNVPVIVISGKVLKSEHIERINFPHVIYQTKDILNFDETNLIFQQAFTGTIQLSQYNSLLVKRVVAFLQENYTQPLSLQLIAQRIGVSKKHLEKQFHQEVGITLWEYLIRYRIKTAKHLLETTNLNITGVAAQVGFEDPAYFSRIFRIKTGQSPKEYRLSRV